MNLKNNERKEDIKESKDVLTYILEALSEQISFDLDKECIGRFILCQDHKK